MFILSEVKREVGEGPLFMLTAWDQDEEVPGFESGIIAQDVEALKPLAVLDFATIMDMKTQRIILEGTRQDGRTEWKETNKPWTR